MSDEPIIRWPISRWMSPSALSTYHQCPLRVRYDLERVEVPPTFVLYYAKGTVTHAALKKIADAMARNVPTISDNDVLAMARHAIPQHEFPSVDAWEANLRDVVHWVQKGRAYLNAMRDPQFLNIEGNLTRAWKLFPDVPHYTIMARPDLIVKRRDHEGNWLIDIIDYKTGKPRPEGPAPVVLRFVARTLLRGFGIDPEETPVQFSYLWLAEDTNDVVELSREYCNDAWPAIEESMRALAAESEWEAHPTFLCHYCKYYKVHCPHEIPGSEYLD